MQIFGMGCGFLLLIFVVKYAYVQGNRRCISALGYEDGKSVNILWGKILWVWKFLLILHSQSGLDALVAWHGECENSSVGRARPCQGRGRGFESRFSLTAMSRWRNW